METTNTYQSYADIVISSFDTEIARYNINPDVATDMIETMANYYHTVKWYNFFISANVSNYAIDIFSNSRLRDLMLNLQSRVELLTTMLHIDLDEVINGIVSSNQTAVMGSRSNSNSLIPADVMESIFVEPTALGNMLRSNHWLMLFYVLLLYFDRTVTYSVLNSN